MQTLLSFHSAYITNYQAQGFTTTLYFMRILSLFASFSGYTNINVLSIKPNCPHFHKSLECEVDMKWKSVSHQTEHTQAFNKLSLNASQCLLSSWFLSSARQQDIYLCACLFPRRSHTRQHWEQLHLFQIDLERKTHVSNFRLLWKYSAFSWMHGLVTASL